jgi:hypothetical protein
LKKVNFKNFFRKFSAIILNYKLKLNRFNVFIPGILTILLIVYSFTNTVSYSENYFPLVNRINENLITPESNLKKIDPFDKIISQKSFHNSSYIENLFKDWNRLFDLFISNPVNRYKTNSLTSRELERISGKVINNVQDEFKLGNVENLVSELGDEIIKECNYYKLDWRLVLAVIRQESYFNPNAVSRAGAFGLMQIMPRTGAGLQGQLKLEETNTPKNNLIAGIYYYASLISQFREFGDDKYKFALAAYNAGLGRVIDAMTITAYFEEDYKNWENVKEAYPYLHSGQDSIHALVWPESKRPPYGTLDNWKEPYNYVNSIMFYYNAYKKMYESNLPEEKPKTTPKKKKKKS